MPRLGTVHAYPALFQVSARRGVDCGEIPAYLLCTLPPVMQPRSALTSADQQERRLEKALAIWCSPLEHKRNSLTCGYLLPGMRQMGNAAGHSHGGSSPSRTHAYVHADSPCM